MTNDELVQRFDNVIEEIYHRANEECGYDPTYLRSMYTDFGGVETARRLLKEDEPSDGFFELAKRDCLHISVEAHVLQEPWRQLFSEKELEIARGRLKANNFDVSQLE